MNCALYAMIGWSLIAAPPKTTQLFPSAITRGAFPVLVVSEGDQGTDPQVWVDDPALQIVPGPKAGQFLASAKTGCRVGWHAVRFHNKEGVSDPISLWVDDLPNFAEEETNNAADNAQKLLMPSPGGTVRVLGKLERNGDLDGFRVTVPAGRTLVARVQAHRQLGSPMDSTLQISDAKGFVLAHNDDTRGNDPELTWTARESTDVIVRIFAFPSDPNSTIGFAGGSNYIYALTLSTGPAIDHVAPVAMDTASDKTKPIGWNLTADTQARLEFALPDLPFATASIEGAEPVLVVRSLLKTVAEPSTDAELKLTPPVLAYGRILEEGQRKAFLIEAKKGENWNFRVFSKTWESPLDPVLTIRKTDGQILVEQDDSGNNTRDVDLAWAVPEDGIYQVEITDLHRRGGERFAFGLEVTNSGLPAELSVPATSLTVKAGEKAEFALNFDKRAAIEHPVKVVVQGLPKGFPDLKPMEPTQAAPAEAAKKGGGRRRGGNAPAQNAIKIPVELTADQVKAIGAWSGPVRFIATDASGKRLPIRFAAPRGPLMGLDHVWMTVLLPDPPKEKPKEEPKKGE